MINPIRYVLTVLCLMLVISCTEKHQHNTHHVKEYRQRVHNNDGTDDWLYWYVLTQNDQPYSYQSSSTPITNYSTMTPTRVETPGKLPEEVEQQVKESEPQNVVELNDNQITEQMEFDFDQPNDQQSNNDVEPSSDNDSSVNSAGDSSSDSGDSGGDSGGGGE